MTPLDTTFPAPAAEGRYTRPKLKAALAEVCASLGFDPRGARLLRFVNNGVFLLRRHPVVVRIVLAPSFSYRALSVVDAARWLADEGVPTVRLLPGYEQPVRVGEHVATVWEAVRHTDPAPTGRDLGTLLRQVHALTPPAWLPEWQPVREVRRRLADAEDLDQADRSFLARRCDDLEERLARLSFPMPRSAVHGDAHLGNLISGPGGPVLCDLDSLCAGPPEWDLTPMAVGHLRLGRSPEPYRQLADAYGFDVTRWEGFDALRELRELKITVSVLPIVRSNPRVRRELERRLRTLREGDRITQWAPYT